MDDRSTGPGALDRLTPELAAEVRRNLLLWLGGSVGVFAAFSVLFAVAVDPSVSGLAGGVAAAMFGFFLAILVPFAGALLTLVYPLGCWPALLRRRVLRERFGVPGEAVSGQARRQLTGHRGLWAATGLGAAVGFAFAAAAALAWWAATGKLSLGFLAVLLVFFAGNLAAQAWVVRRAVAQTPTGRDPAPGHGG